MRRERAGRRWACTVAGLSSGNSTHIFFFICLFFFMQWISQSLPSGGQFYWSPLITTHLSGSYGSNGQLFFVYLNTRHTHPWAAAFTKKGKNKKQKQHHSNLASIGKPFSHYFSYHTIYCFNQRWERRTYLGGEGKDTRRLFLWIFTILISQVGVDGYVYG